ncbi:hypothetical protein HOLleu_26747 [Holothuria leucospilota]|uniref:Uncharacterized protein n=1 Tax=Holothuria leucospilota TaxID=206669 RepID=A0A9Q1BPC2_HOLLE|nr:hypothetical protein HOLleu_26747 [Holothuria leucospilota]
MAHFDAFIAANRSKPVKPNLRPQERKAIGSLRRNPDITIRPADKGGALTILNTADYIKEVESQLSNQVFYRTLTQNPVKLLTHQVDLLCRNISASSTAKVREFIPIQPKLGTFYTLPKIHKLPTLIASSLPTP